VFGAVSSDLSSNFGAKDPLRALYLAYQTGEKGLPLAGPAESDPEAAVTSLAELGRNDLVKRLDEEMRAQSAWTLFFHSTVAERLNLNPTDHKCLDMIWRGYETSKGAAYMTPGQLARETKLTTGAVTGVLDRLEQAGYVLREHDPEDRRRIIVRPVPERIKADIWPLFEWLSAEFQKLCGEYSDEELRRMIEFSRRTQELLQHATKHLRELDQPELVQRAMEHLRELGE
jgi:DNA-binding MarR family transcriptional regulator